MVTVVKIGGRLTEGPFLDRIGADIASHDAIGQLLIVHGGGDLVTRLGEKMGIRQEFVTAPSGVRSRYVDDATLQACLMVLAGLVNTRVVQALARSGINGIGLTGADCSLIQAERREKILVMKAGKKMVMDGGHSGRPSTINSALLIGLLGMRVVPVVAPLGIDTCKEMVNMDGDSAASALAVSLKAETLLFLTDVDGVILGGRIIPRISRDELDRVITRAGVGMNRKLMAASKALEGGVSRVVISNGKIEQPISSALLSGRGTIIR